jgi:hypothetical protein
LYVARRQLNILANMGGVIAMYVKDLAFKAIFKIFSSICKLCFDINAWFCGAKIIFFLTLKLLAFGC